MGNDDTPKLIARTTPGRTLLAFAGVLACALPYFIWAKRGNDKKKKERHMDLLRGGAFSQMSSGSKTSIKPKTVS